MNNAQETIFGMLKENTGKAICDSGGAYGRNWERNSKKTFDDFLKESPVSFDMPEFGDDIETTSEDIKYTVSLFHYIPTVLEVDELCQEFNEMPVSDWDGEAYGLSKKGEKWLKKHGFSFGESWNTYNGECTLSQTLQGTNLTLGGCGEGEYILLQVHGGCDVRGGYTDAKLFKLRAFQEFLSPTPLVFGRISRGKKVLEVSSGYNGVSLTDEDGKAIALKKRDSIELFLYAEFN